MSEIDKAHNESSSPVKEISFLFQDHVAASPPGFTLSLARQHPGRAFEFLRPSLGVEVGIHPSLNLQTIFRNFFFSPTNTYRNIRISITYSNISTQGWF
ncbi:hypothetical protein TNIN_326161 [Trichonephila inaurata madagascariensis]|uniref:Uncharacterized protein n=1 Tax=Trichonephila inaurata madagascariensis TaxID=2747483 RepID=A0A8X6YKB8_9ARAC|nr:hypothetical protein TNIN_326161 [Trichonephila inaurata madagascariensis]